MDFEFSIIFLLLILTVALAAVWIFKYGILRGVLAAIARLAWILPVFLAFFPKVTITPVSRTLSLNPINVLLDDSQSMKTLHQKSGTTFLQSAEDLLDDVRKACLKVGCEVREKRLSELHPAVAERFSPLSDVIGPWLDKSETDPWIIISDGGDWRPSLKWDKNLQGTGRSESKNKIEKGLIIGFGETQRTNKWIDFVDIPPFAFEQKPIIINVGLTRGQKTDSPEVVQIQVKVDGNVAASSNAEFGNDDLSFSTAITMPPIARGQHLIIVSVLPTGDESTIWDNSENVQIEVLPNTVGILHLLGAPSWDGRFLRRFLKSEPKFDLISFFILRDPWDEQETNERELSLIPFPVERLFKEELANFRAVIIQNFTLFQFLQQEYQDNLVKFVKDGGGLLFIGGPRALQKSDITSSSLSTILPFTTSEKSDVSQSNPKTFFKNFDESSTVDFNGPYYDSKAKFSVQLADVDEHQRSLANLYDEWELLAEEFSNLRQFEGLHHTENVFFKMGEYSPLLNAVNGGTKSPLAVASYPGKGRAVWIFSDAFWNLAMEDGRKVSRQTYNKFFDAALKWILKEEVRKPLIAKNLRLKELRSGELNWTVELQGPAARYLGTGSGWSFKVCGKPIAKDEIVFEKSNIEKWELSGKLFSSVKPGDRCAFEVTGNHPSFGSLKAYVSEIVPDTIPDVNIGASPLKLEQLAALTGARLISYSNGKTLDSVTDWLEQVSASFGVALPDRYETTKTYYWMLEKWWFLFILVFIPIEVLIRRWNRIFGDRG